MPTTPPAPEPAGSEPPAHLAATEAVLAGLAQEVRTRRLVVVDDRGRERIVAELVGDDAFVRLDLVRREGEGTTGLVLSATDGGDTASLGVEFWAEGNSVGGFDVWRGPDGRWQSDLQAPPSS